MKKLLRRPILAFALGASLAGFAAAGTAAYAALGDDRVSACYAAKTGALYVIGRDGAPQRCLAGDAPIDWSISGPQGPPGAFSGSFKSPNGAYSISVTDEGIVLAGPGSTVSLEGSEITVKSGTDLVLEAARHARLKGGVSATVDGAVTALVKAGATAGVEGGGIVNVKGSVANVEGAAFVNVKGALVRLNAGAACPGVVRRTDLIPVPYGGGVTTPATASTTVCAG
jgi:hypothetical protein